MKCIATTSLIVFSMLSSINTTYSQVGIGTNSPNSSALLELSSSNKGFLPTRMTKAQRDAIVNPETGLIIYCTNCSSTGGGCLVENNGTPTLPVWECLGTYMPSLAANCNGFMSGSYIINTAVNGTYTVTITNNSFNTLTLGFSTMDLVLSGVAGLSVSAVSPTAAVLNPGGSQVVTYVITGTSAAKGTLLGTWTKFSLQCSATKQVTNPLPTFTCNNTISANNYTLTNNNTYTGTITIPYTASLGGDPYPAETIVSNGLIFSSSAGIYTAPAGTITYTISGTYTGANNAVFTITTGSFEGSCTIIIFDAIRSALSQAGCASCGDYDAAAVDNWVSVTSAEYDKAVLISGTGKYVATDAVMANTATQTYVSNATFTANDTYNSRVPVSNYIFAMKVKTGPTGTAIPTMAGMFLKTATAITGMYSNVGGATPSAASALANTTYCFVLKRPTAMTSSASPSFTAMYAPNTNQVGIINIGGLNYSGAGNLSSLVSASSASGQSLVQVLSTPTKQW